MARVLAIANQKGGVAKTTTTQTLGLALADLGERVLLVDLDPQACLTFALGLEPDQCSPTLHDVFLQRVKAADAVIDAGRVRLLPANIDLAGSEVHLLTRTGREPHSDALDTVRDTVDGAHRLSATLGVLTSTARPRPTRRAAAVRSLSHKCRTTASTRSPTCEFLNRVCG